MAYDSHSPKGSLGEASWVGMGWSITLALLTLSTLFKVQTEIFIGRINAQVGIYLRKTVIKKANDY